MTVFLNQSDYAKHRGVARSTIQRMLKKGKFRNASKNINNRLMIDRDKADVILNETLNPIAVERARKIKENKSKKLNPVNMVFEDAEKVEQQQETIEKAGLKMVTLTEAQTKKANYEAALKKLELEEKEGKLIDAEKVEKDLFNLGRLTRDSILNIPDRISSELAAITDVGKINNRLREELISALSELADD